MTEPLQPHEVRDVEALRVLAHPMRQRILRYLRQAGPATSTTLARDLGENSGIMSYHLRQLGDYGFAQEVTGRGQGRERWWQAAPEPTWIPREGLSVEAQAEASGMLHSGLTAELEGFERFRAERAAMGEWGRGTWTLRRARFMLTRDEAMQFLAEQQELISRYQRDARDAPAGARPLVLGLVVYPQPAGESTDSLGEAAGPGI